MNKFLLIISLIFLSNILILKSQNDLNIYHDPKYGSDSLLRVQCAYNLSMMSEFMKINRYDYALPYWRNVFHNCPASSKNIYIYGVRIYHELVAKEKEPSRQQEMIDTLMLIYDRRIEYFGQEELVLGKKGIDLIKYRQEAIQEAYGYLAKSVILSKDNAEENVLITYLKTTVALFKMGQMDAQSVIDNYMDVVNYLEAKIKSGNTEQAELAIHNADAIFSESGAGSCDDLIKTFSPRFEERQDDIEFLKKVITLFEERFCEGSDLFARASENLYKLEPSAQSAYHLSRFFLRLEEFTKAAEYYKKAIDLEKNQDNKAKYYYELARLESIKTEQYPDARVHALEAAKLRPNWGDPYVFIGNLYASSSNICNTDELERNAVFWVAIDQFMKAKSVDTTKIDEANLLITKYSQYFPNAEDAFFYGYQDGDDYIVGCWINEKTRVRTRINQ